LLASYTPTLWLASYTPTLLLASYTPTLLLASYTPTLLLASYTPTLFVCPQLADPGQTHVTFEFECPVTELLRIAMFSKTTQDWNNVALSYEDNGGYLDDFCNGGRYKRIADDLRVRHTHVLIYILPSITSFIHILTPIPSYISLSRKVERY
jgi:hypothetical protein